MACTPVALNGLSLSCGNNLGGISKIYVADIQDIASIDLSGSTVIGIEMVVGKTFAEYTLRKNLSSATYTYNNDDTGSKFVDAAIVAVFTKMDSTMREEIQNLMSSQFYVIVLDNNGNYNLVGYSSGIQTYVYANSVGSTGTNISDSNNFTVNFASQQYELPYFVDADVIPAII